MSIFYVSKGSGGGAIEDPSLKIRDNFLPPGFFFPSNTTINRIVAVLSSPPVGSSAILEIKNEATTIATMTIPSGLTVSNVYLEYTIPANTLITVNVTQIGATEPGKDLAILIVRADDGGGGDHLDSDHADAFEPLGTLESHRTEADPHGDRAYTDSITSGLLSEVPSIYGMTIIRLDDGTWSADAPARPEGTHPIVFVGDIDPADPTNGIITPANINDSDRWVDTTQ